MSRLFVGLDDLWGGLYLVVGLFMPSGSSKFTVNFERSTNRLERFNSKGLRGGGGVYFKWVPIGFVRRAIALLLLDHLLA